MSNTDQSNPLAYLNKKNEKSWFARYNTIPVEEEDIDLDDINMKNFFKYMKGRLMIKPEYRTEKDIEILKKCTLFLNFFSNIVKVDPKDTYKAHENGCRKLLYRKQKKGEIVTKYKDVSKEFYISLNGKIGIYVPRPREQITKELDAIEWIIQAFKDNYYENKKIITHKELKSLDKKFGDNHIHAEHWRKFKEIRVEENKIIYDDEYFKSVNGGLNVSDIIPESDIVTEEDVKKII